MQSHRQTVRTSVLLSEAQHARLNELASKGDVSVAWVIRQAVQKFLDDIEQEQMPLPMKLAIGAKENA